MLTKPSSTQAAWREVPKSLAQSKKTTKALELVKKYPGQTNALAKAVLATQGLHVRVERLKEARRPRHLTKYQAQGFESQFATLVAQVKELTKAVDKFERSTRRKEEQDLKV